MMGLLAMLRGNLWGAASVLVLALLVIVGAYRAGEHVERSRWQKLELVREQRIREEYARAMQEVRDKERQIGERIMQTAAAYEKELDHVKAERDRLIADLRARRVVLRDPGKPSIGLHPVPGAAASAAGCDDQKGGELSEATSEFLVGLASEADEVVLQLSACQDSIVAYVGNAARASINNPK